MDFTREEPGENQFTNQLQLGVSLGLPCSLTVVCRSASRNGTSFEIVDQNQESMGTKTFRCDFGPISGKFNCSLVEELNVLLEEFGVEISPDELRPVAELAVSKCESRYGNGIEDGDCIITLH